VNGTQEPRFPLCAPPAAWRMPPGPAPTFAVVIPVYEGAAVIAEAIESVLEQTKPPSEIVVVDDGSTDGLESTLGPYRRHVRLVRTPHRGVAAARNTALAATQAEFVAMLDSDDVYLPERLEALAELGVARPDLDVLVTDALIEVGGTTVARFHELTPFETEDQRAAILRRCFFAWPAVRRSRLAAIGGFDESLRTGSDWEAAIRLVLSGCGVGLVDVPLYRYRRHERALTADRLQALTDRVRLLDSTTSHPGLDPRERATLRASLASKRRRVLRAEAEIAIRRGDRSARRAALRLATAAGASVGERRAGLVWALAPGRARRVLEHQPRRTVASSPPFDVD
jgi:GT2 family glycosyltransferase